MTRSVLLDAGVLGLLVSAPGLPPVAARPGWPARAWSEGLAVLVPAVADYEVRRELVRLGAAAKLRRLDAPRKLLGAAPASPEARAKAAGSWAIVRRAGVPTAHPQAPDGDAILAGASATIGGEGDLVPIITDNVGHLTRFPGVGTLRWQDELGRVGGRKRRVTPGKVGSARKLPEDGMAPRDVAENLGVSIPTLYRWDPATSRRADWLGLKDVQQTPSVGYFPSSVGTSRDAYHEPSPLPGRPPRGALRGRGSSAPGE